MSIHDQKEKLREQLLQKRKAIPDSYYTEASEDIIAHLQTLPAFRQSRTVHSYVSIRGNNEVDTHDFLRWMLATNKRVIVPVTEFEKTELRHVELNSFEELTSNKWGVPEPDDGREVPLAELDLVIVPMVGADLYCNRLGYGKGFYDRFLSNVNCPAVGLCFEDCVVDKIPTEPFDVKLSAVVTEERILRKD